MEAILNSSLFGIVLSIGCYALGTAVNRRLKSPLANPLLIAIALCVTVLTVFRIPLAQFQKGGSIISLLLAPATAVLGVSIYRQMDILKKHLLPVLCGCLAGSVASMGSAWLLCRAFGLSDALTASMLPKSVTTAIAMEISRQQGGIVPVTVAVVILTGILGAVISPLLIRIFRVKHPVAAGVAIGTSSHAIGTTKAIEIGEVQGAMSGIAIGVAGIITVILSLFLR